MGSGFCALEGIGRNDGMIISGFCCCAPCSGFVYGLRVMGLISTRALSSASQMAPSWMVHCSCMVRCASVAKAWVAAGEVDDGEVVTGYRSFYRPGQLSGNSGQLENRLVPSPWGRLGDLSDRVYHYRFNYVQILHILLSGPPRVFC